MKSNKINVVIFFGTVLLSFLISNKILAHTLSGKQGSEATGYVVGPEHPATKSFTFSNQNSTANNIAACRVGKNRWNSTGLVNIQETNQFSTGNYIYDYSDRNSSTIAYNQYWYNSQTKIISRFCLYFNNYYMSQYSSSRKNQIATHEWGHSFGLKDLYNNSNKDKIMYGYGNTMTATVPTAKDKEGAKIGIK